MKITEIEKLSKKEKGTLLYFIVRLVLDPLNYIGKGFIDDNDIDLLFKVVRESK